MNGTGRQKKQMHHEPFSSSFNGFGSNMWKENTGEYGARKSEPLEMPPGFTKRRRSKTNNPFQTSMGSIFHNVTCSGANVSKPKKSGAARGLEEHSVPKLALGQLHRPKSTFRESNQMEKNVSSRASTKRSTCSSLLSCRSFGSDGVREEVRDLVRQETSELKKILHASFESRIQKENNIRLLQAEIERLKRNDR